jgi:hypothetical protein
MTVTKPKLKRGKWGAMHDKVRVIGQMLHNGEKPDVKILAAQFKCTDKYIYLLIAAARKMTGITKTPSKGGTKSKNPDLPLPLSNRKLRMQGTSMELPITMEEPEANVDMVNHPPHYTVGGIETIDYIQAKLTPEEFRGYLKGNALKYASRTGHKGNPEEDLGKMLWYSERLLKSYKP